MANTGDIWSRWKKIGETQCMRKDERHKLYIMEMKYLRSKCGKTRLNRWRNEGMRRRFGVREKMSGRVSLKVLYWLRHVNRTSRD